MVESVRHPCPRISIAGPFNFQWPIIDKIHQTSEHTVARIPFDIQSVNLSAQRRMRFRFSHWYLQTPLRYNSQRLVSPSASRSGVSTPQGCRLAACLKSRVAINPDCFCCLGVVLQLMASATIKYNRLVSPWMRPMTMHIGVETVLGLVYASPIPNAYLTQGDLWVNGAIDSGSQKFVMAVRKQPDTWDFAMTRTRAKVIDHRSPIHHRSAALPWGSL